MQRILITEDDDMLIGLYRGIVKMLPDVRVSFARSPDESRMKIASESFDLALFDINLGAAGGEGIDLLDHIRACAPQTVTIMMSTQDDDATRARCAAAQTFVTKNTQFIPTLAMILVETLDSLRGRAVAQAVA